MSLDSIPLELVKKIFYYLMTDGQAFVSLASTCKLFSHLANEFQLTPEWKQFLPVTFHASQKGFKPIQNIDCNCLTLNNRRCIGPCDASFWHLNKLYSPIKCYAGRLQSLVNCKHRRFSTIKFKNSILENLECLNCFNDASRDILKSNVNSLVGVELVGCSTTLHCLDRLLSFLPNLSYLSLASTSQCTCHGKFENKKDSGVQKLDMLKLNRYCPAPIYNWITNRFVASTLDFSELAIRANVYTRGPRQQLNVMAVLPYVKRCLPLLKHLILDKTNIEPAGVKRILRDEDLKDLKITVRNCDYLTKNSRNALIGELYEDELVRVTF